MDKSLLDSTTIVQVCHVCLLAAAEFAFLVFLTLFLGVQDTLKHFLDAFDARFVAVCLFSAALWQCSSSFLTCVFSTDALASEQA